MNTFEIIQNTAIIKVNYQGTQYKLVREQDFASLTYTLFSANGKDIIDENGVESEQLGIEFCKNLLGNNTNWVQTSYNKKFREKYAGIGDLYDSENDIFISRRDYFKV